MKYSKITSAIWGNLEDTIVTGHEGGELMLWDLRKKPNELHTRTRPHNKTIMDLQKDQHSTCFISASKDSTAKVIFDNSNNLKFIPYVILYVLTIVVRYGYFERIKTLQN